MRVLKNSYRRDLQKEKLQMIPEKETKLKYAKGNERISQATSTDAFKFES